MKKKGVSGTLADILLKRRIVTVESLPRVEEDAKAAGLALEKFLVEKKMATAEDVTLAISEYLDMPPISLAHFVPDTALMESLTKEVLTKYQIIPLARTGNHLTIAMADPFDIVAIDDLRMATGLGITPLAATNPPSETCSSDRSPTTPPTTSTWKTS